MPVGSAVLGVIEDFDVARRAGRLGLAQPRDRRRRRLRTLEHVAGLTVFEFLERVASHALEGGVDPFDATSGAGNDDAIGRVLRHVEGVEPEKWFPDAPRDIVPIYDYTPEGIRRSFDESLERLGLDHIDIVLMHDAEDYIPEAINNAFPVLADLRSQGLIKAIGLGMNYVGPALEIMKNTDLDIALIAGRFTLLDQVAQHDLFPYALKNKIDISMGGVLNSGVLANPVAGATYNYLPASDEIIARAKKICDFLKERDVPLIAAALQFPLRHPAVTSVLTGPRTAAELRSNAEDFNRPLPESIWSELEDAGLIEKIQA